MPRPPRPPARSTPTPQAAARELADETIQDAERRSAAAGKAIAEKRATVEAVLAKQEAAAREQAQMLLEDAKQRSDASDKALTDKRARVERELAEEQGNAKIRAAKIVEDAEQRPAEANHPGGKAHDFQ